MIFIIIFIFVHPDTGCTNVDVKVVVTKSFGKAKVNLARGWVIASIIVVLITLYEIHL